ACLAEADIHVVRITDDANRRAAFGRYAPDFAGGQRDLRPVGFAGAEHRGAAGAAANLGAAAWLHLDAVDVHAKRDLLERHAMPHARLNVCATDDAIARLQAFRRENVRLRAVFVLQQRDAAGAIRIVFNRDDRRPDVVLDALEIDDAVHLLVPAATKARRRNA